MANNIPLKLTPDFCEIELKPINGFCEIFIEKNSTKNLIDLLDLLIVKEKTGKLEAKNIVIADRDRIIGELYIDNFGEKIDSTIVCKKCEQKIDLDFSLRNILSQFQIKANSVAKNGIYKIDKNISFRLPIGEDELAIEGLSKTEAENILVERCIIKGKNEKEKIQQRMDEIAPILKIDLRANCPECNTTQIVKFDLQTFFMAKFLQEKSKLLSEIHALAIAYHWSKNDILELPRSQRKQFFNLIRSNN